MFASMKNLKHPRKLLLLHAEPKMVLLLQNLLLGPLFIRAQVIYLYFSCVFSILKLTAPNHVRIFQACINKQAFYAIKIQISSLLTCLKCLLDHNTCSHRTRVSTVGYSFHTFISLISPSSFYSCIVFLL